jgi:hypothetical protein
MTLTEGGEARALEEACDRFALTVRQRRGGSTFAIALTGTVLVAAVLSGCGTKGQDKAAQRLANVSVLSSTAPLQSRMVTQAEVEHASDAAATRTFLQLWSRLQFESWPAALELFEPGLRRAIGDATLSQALGADLVLWQASKPGVVSTRVVGSIATIQFVIRDEKNNLVPSSITFRRSGRRWRVVYMSLLDTALQRSVQTRVQAAIEPLATKPAAEAVRQGYAALSLQSAYLQKELGAAAAEEARRASRKKGP